MLLRCVSQQQQRQQLQESGRLQRGSPADLGGAAGRRAPLGVGAAAQQRVVRLAGHPRLGVGPGPALSPLHPGPGHAPQPGAEPPHPAGGGPQEAGGGEEEERCAAGQAEVRPSSSMNLLHCCMRGRLHQNWRDAASSTFEITFQPTLTTFCIRTMLVFLSSPMLHDTVYTITDLQKCYFII